MHEPLRVHEPMIHGYYPSRPASNFFVLVGVVISAGLYDVAKLTAMGFLGSVSPIRLIAWLLLECTLLLLIRMFIGNWRVYIRGVHGTLPGLYTHFLFYICMMAAPFPVLRTPFFLTPSVYVGFILWTLCCSNPMMIMFASWSGDPELSVAVVWPALAVASIACLFSMLLVFNFITPELRHTFYRHNTCKMHLKNFWWDKATNTSFKGNYVFNDQDLVRAQTLAFFAPMYVPKDAAKEWLAENWPLWEAEERRDESPRFFTFQWKQQIPRACVPEGVDVKVRTPTSQDGATWS